MLSSSSVTRCVFGSAFWEPGLKVRATLEHFKYHQMAARVLCFYLISLISQRLEVRGHKSGSWQMLRGLCFLHGDLMLTRVKLGNRFTSCWDVRVTWDLPVVIMKGYLDQKSNLDVFTLWNKTLVHWEMHTDRKSPQRRTCFDSHLAITAGTEM